MGDDGRVTEAEARELCSRAFVRFGVAVPAAQEAAVALTTTEMMGIRTHGLNRVVDYTSRIAAGGMDPKALPVIERVAPALVKVDGQNALGPITATRAVAAGIAAAQEAGMAGVFVRRGTHVGALAPYLLQAAQAGCAAIFTSNTAPMIAPPGARKAMVGNMPLGIAVPDAAGEPLLLDMAMTVVARSHIRAAAEAGRSIPDTWGSAPDGRPTTDPKAALAGVLAAMGGDKGASLALALDLFSGLLSGARFLDDISDTHKSPGARTELGYALVLVAASKLQPESALSQRLGQARMKLASAPARDPDHPARLPGARALAELRKARAEGFRPDPQTLARVRALASD